MKKIIFILLLISIIVLSGCGSQKGSNAAAAAENYIIALAEKNKTQVICLSCKECD